MFKYYIFIVLSVIYLLNLTMGIFEIPDNLPFVGNLDEAAASLLLFQSIRQIRENKRQKNGA